MTPAAAYAHCRALARTHYENFPVASLLLPSALRDPVAAIYAFARTADDFADEGRLHPIERLALLSDWGARLDAAAAGEQPPEPLFIALADAIPRFGLPLQPFHDLISAFQQDVRLSRYRDFPQLLDYCRRSADPVGRLLLHLAGAASEENLARSDRVCTALQLINFLQDLQQDYHELGRIYLPQEEMAAYGVTEEELRDARNTPAMRELLAFQLRRARGLLLEGAPLGRALRGRFGLEIRLIVQGGLRVCELLEGAENPFARPRLGKGEYLRLIWRAL